MAKRISPFQTALDRYLQKTRSPSQKEIGLQSASSIDNQRLAALVSEEQDLAAFLDDPHMIDTGEYEAAGQTQSEVQADIARRKSNLDQRRLQMQEAKTMRYRGAQKGLVGSITTMTAPSEIRRRIGGAASSSSTYLQSLGNVGRSSSSLESDYAVQMEAISNIGGDLKSMAGNLNDPGTLSEYRSKIAEISNLESSAALTKRTLRTQRQLGLDPESTVGAAQSIVGRISKTDERRTIESIAGSGGFRSLEVEADKLSDMFKTLQTTLEQYKDASEKGVDAQEEIGEKLRQETSAVARQESIVGAIQRHGGGGGGNTMGYINAGITAGNAITGAASQMMISQPLQIMDNQRRFADMANRQYGRIGAVTQGDQMALLQTLLMDPQRNALAEDKFGTMQTLLGSEALLGGIGTIGNTAMAATKGLKAGGKVGALLSGINAGAGGAADFFVKAADIRKGITAGTTAANFGERFEQLFQSMQTIPARQLQAYEDISRGSYAATTGLGAGRANQLMGQMMSPALMKRAAALNISPQQLLASVSTTGQLVGGRDFEMESVFSAGAMEKAGITSQSQYQTLLGQMSDVGGKNRDLEEILRKSVAAGMDDSKNIGRMVDATVSISGAGANQGIISGVGIADTMLKFAAGARGSDMTASQKMRMAANATGNFNRMLGADDPDNVFEMMEFAQFANLMPGAVHEQVTAMASLDASGFEMLRTLKNADPDSAAYASAAKSLKRSGLSMLFRNKQGGIRQDLVDKALDIKSGTVLSKAAGIATSLGAEGLAVAKDALRTGDFSALSEEQQSILRIRLNEAGLGELYGASALFATDRNIAGAPTAAGGTRASVFGKLSAGAKFQAGEFGAGQERYLDMYGPAMRGVSQKANISDMDFEEFQEAMMTPEERRLQRVTGANRKVGDLMTQAARNPELARMGDAARNEAIRTSAGPEAFSFEKQSKDFKDGVIVFEEGVKKFNELVNTMAGGATDRNRSTSGSEHKNTAGDLKSSKNGIGGLLSMPSF